MKQTQSAFIVNVTPLAFIFFFCIVQQFAFSQRANNWYFGANAGISFSATPPATLSNGAVNTSDNSSSISDASGNLLFYTDGSTVWNKNHAVMANGSGLIGSYTAGQSAIIVPVPCSATKYVIFHVTDFSNPGYLNYTVVDMSLNSGLGDVVSTQKNVSLGSGWTEKLCAYYNAAGNNYWVLTHKWNSNQFYAFEVSATTIASQTVISSIGAIHNCGTVGGLHDAMGQLTISPDGTKVINTLTCQDKIELFDFNSTTGALSNSISLPGNGNGAWGTAFSPDSKNIYVNTIFGQSIYQYNLATYNYSAIIASLYTVVTTGTSGYNFGYMELGPGGRIYIAHPNANNISVIGNPNASGSACNFSLTGQSLGSKTSTWGLSRIAYNIPQLASVSLSVAPPVTNVCAGQTITLTASGASSYSWSNGSTSPSISVSPAQTTTYMVTGSTSSCTSSSTVSVAVSPSVSVSIAGNSLVCLGQGATLTASGAASYTWNTSATGSVLVVYPTGVNFYTVTGVNAQGNCPSNAVFSVQAKECGTLTTGFVNTEEVKPRIFPNPFHDRLTLQMDGHQLKEIKVFNLIGDLVFTLDDAGIKELRATSSIDIPLGHLPEGVYTMKVISLSGISEIKLLRED